MSFTAPQRFLRGVSNHQRGDALGSFPNPMLDPFRWMTFWEDFAMIPGQGSIAGYGGGFNLDETATGATLAGLANLKPSAFLITPGTADNDVTIAYPASTTIAAGDALMVHSTVPLVATKDIIVAARFQTESADDQDFAIGLGQAAKATVIDTTPAGLLIMGTDTWTDIKVRIGDMATVTVALSAARAANTYYDVVAYYRGKDQTLHCWLDNVYISESDAAGALVLTTGMSAVMGTQNGSATASNLLVDYLMVAIER